MNCKYNKEYERFNKEKIKMLKKEKGAMNN